MSGTMRARRTARRSAAERPLIDFGVNAMGAVTVLDSVRRHCGEAVFTLVSTAKVYGDVDSAQLRLITCGGEFDSSARSYVDNIVVYAERST